MPLVNTGTCNASAASRSAATASPAYTSEPAMMTGCRAAASSAAARATSSGSGSTTGGAGGAGAGDDPVEKITSSGKSRKTGPRCAVSAAVSAAVTAAGISSVSVTVAACLVTGATSGRWSISCRLPAPQRNCGARPASTTTGTPLKYALVKPEMPLVTPGPAVSTASAGRRWSLATASAAKTADCSWRTSSRRRPIECAASYSGKTCPPESVNISATPAARSAASARSPPCPPTSLVIL